MVYLQRWQGWCHMKLLPSRRKFCVHHTTMHHVTWGKATYIWCMHVQQQPATCTSGRMTGIFYVLLRYVIRGWNGGGTDTEIRVSTETRPWRRKFSRRSCRDSNPQPFNHESGALTTELSRSLCGAVTPRPRCAGDRVLYSLFTQLSKLRK